MILDDLFLTQIRDFFSGRQEDWQFSFSADDFLLGPVTCARNIANPGRVSDISTFQFPMLTS